MGKVLNTTEYSLGFILSEGMHDIWLNTESVKLRYKPVGTF